MAVSRKSPVMAVVSKVSSALHHEEKDLELLNFDAKGLESVLNEEHYSSKQDDESSFSPTQRPCLNTQYTPIKTPASLHRLTTNPTTFPSTPSKTSACHNEADEVFKEATALKQTTKSTNRTDCLLKEGTEATTFVRSFVRQLYNSFGPYTTENQHRPIPSYNLLLALCLAGSAPALCLLLLPTLIFLVFALVALLPVSVSISYKCVKNRYIALSLPRFQFLLHPISHYSGYWHRSHCVLFPILLNLGTPTCLLLFYAKEEAD